MSVYTSLRPREPRSLRGWVIVAVLLAGCSTTTIHPVPSSAFTLLPSESPIPSATPTKTPTPTPIPTSTPAGILLEPRGTPLKEWNGIPILPGALAGEAGEGYYAFKTQASLETIAAYYLQTMRLRDWSFLGANQDESIALLLIFGQDEYIVSIAVFDVTPYLVMLVYYQTPDSTSGQ